MSVHLWLGGWPLFPGNGLDRPSTDMPPSPLALTGERGRHPSCSTLHPFPAHSLTRYPTFSAQFHEQGRRCWSLRPLCRHPACSPGVRLLQGPVQAHLGRAVQGPRLLRRRHPGLGCAVGLCWGFPWRRAASHPPPFSVLWPAMITLACPYHLIFSDDEGICFVSEAHTLEGRRML